jgi:hypothetical protein
VSAFGVPSSQIVSEIIDGEAVILDLRCGRYYTTELVGAEVWRAATEGVAGADIVSSCRAHFPDQSEVESDVGAHLEALVAAGLLERQDESNSTTQAALTWPNLYTAPDLKCYDDLADMLALDPVHDVDAAGWPTPLSR